MEVTAGYLGRSRVEVVARGHRVICDQPVADGGTDAGMTPPEFVLAALASCAAYYGAEYLEARRLSPAQLKVRVSAEKALHPARLDSFRIEVGAPGLDERHQTGVLRAVKSCLIHNTLLGAPGIDVSLTSGPLQSESELIVATGSRN